MNGCKQTGGSVVPTVLLWSILCIISLLPSASTNAQALPAFLGAEGGGAESIGGRGGIVYEVTNLNDSGPGSLRAGVEMTGPRTIVFRTGGTIQLLSLLRIRNPFITIAGQTAPGGGIQISGKLLTGDSDVFSVDASDVTIRYLRFRKGKSAVNEQFGDVIKVQGNGDRVVIDHVTATWTQDENGGISSGPTKQTKNTTISWSLFAEPLLEHPMNFFTGASERASTDNMTNIDLHHCLFANASDRNPAILLKSVRYVNNITYNWANDALQIGGGEIIDVIGNIFKRGPLYPGGSGAWEVRVFPAGNQNAPTGDPSIYITGNIGDHAPTTTDDDWAMTAQMNCLTCAVVGPLSTSYRRLTAQPALAHPITHYPADQLESRLLPIVGASQKLDCLGNWVLNRDTADTRIINEYTANQGKIPASEDEVGGFPILAPGTACTDTDHDGMPDQWETAKGLNPNNASDGPTIHTSGYSHLERYLNGESATTTSCNTVTTSNFSQGAYNSYGAPFDAFQTSTNLVNTQCNSADTHTINLTTGVTGDTTRIVYTKGYWYDAVTTAWRQYTGTCTGALNGEWCQGSVSATITDPNVSTASAGAPTYLVGMTCSIQGGSWKCGCRNTSCTNFSWQIQGAGLP